MAREVDAPVQMKQNLKSVKIRKIGIMTVWSETYLGLPPAIFPAPQSSLWHHEFDPPAQE
jgi:hypothetical protein